MSEIYVPVSTNQKLNKEKTLEQIKKLNPKMMFVAIVDRAPFEKGEARDKIIGDFVRDSKMYNDAGFPTACWINTLGFGESQMRLYNEKPAKNFARRVSIEGRTLNDCLCPLDENVKESLCSYVYDLAKAGAKLIVIDDEMVVSGIPGIGCACDLHMAEYQKRIGEDIKREEIPKLVFTGGKNRYRDEWYRLNGDTMRNLCKALREAVNRVDENIRLGFCAGFTSWDLEYIDAIELSYILAGKTKPFLRLTAAPYWYACKRFGAQPLQTIYEMTRQQIKWCEGHDIDIFTENDTYPHNRFATPASYINAFGLMTRVSDNIDELRYVLGYFSQPDYEERYINDYMNAQELYQEIEHSFSDKKHIGIRIYEEKNVIQNADLPEKYLGEDMLRMLWLNQASWIPTLNAIPTTYDGSGVCGMVCGENAKYLPEEAFSKGLILDVTAAEILQKKGIDCGLKSAKLILETVTEDFLEYGTEVIMYSQSGLYELETNQSAKVLSTFVGDRTNHTPASYLYENKDGQRFLVYAVRFYKILPRTSFIASYCRGRQLNDAMQFLGGTNMPVVCNGHPMLYCILKGNETSIAAAYFNCHPDEINDAIVKLDFTPGKIKFINCEGRIDGNTVVIKHIKAYGMVAFEAEYI